MDKLNASILIIDDDVTLKKSNIGLFTELEMNFQSVEVKENLSDAIQYIKAHFENERLIILLDLDFPSAFPDGHEILESIREISFLIPVIIWSGVDEHKENFSDLINNRAFAFLSKSDSTEAIISKLKEAYEYSTNDVSIALEEWILIHSEDEKDKPFMMTVEGKQMSLNDILKEVRLQTKIGQNFAKNLNKLTIDLLSRNKEQLND